MENPKHSLIIKHLRGQASPEESRQVKSWIEASPDHQKEFEKIRSTWESLGGEDPDYQPDLQKAWEKIEEGIEPPVLSIGKWIYRVAAVLLIGLGIGYFLLTPHQLSEPGPVLALTEIVAEDTLREITLPDGSVISLNKGASLTYGEDFGLHERRVTLEGEAFFDVRRDEQHPFIIQSGATTTRVLGTSFLISPGKEALTVNVVTGLVALESNRGEVIRLSAGEKGRYSHDDGSLSKSINRDQNFLSWKTGELIFENASITQVVGDLERHYRVKFDINRETTFNLTATFSQQPLDEVLEVVTATLEIDVEQLNPTQYVIK